MSCHEIVCCNAPKGMDQFHVKLQRLPSAVSAVSSSRALLHHWRLDRSFRPVFNAGAETAAGVFCREIERIVERAGEAMDGRSWRCR